MGIFDLGIFELGLIITGACVLYLLYRVLSLVIPCMLRKLENRIIDPDVETIYKAKIKERFISQERKDAEARQEKTALAHAAWLERKRKRELAEWTRQK